MLKTYLIKAMVVIRFDYFIDKFVALYEKVKAERYRIRFGENFQFVNQGPGGFEICGMPGRFTIGKGSHIKSATFIECSGGVSIGDYFHTGRELTIFSTNHNWKTATKIPYDEVSVDKPVIIGNFVWCGANVTILPGTIIGDGAIIAAGSVLRGVIPERAVVAGNPACIVSYRDKDHYNYLLNNGRFY